MPMYFKAATRTCRRCKRPIVRFPDASPFFEQRNGNCRLMAPFAERLAQTAATWAHTLAPIAERVARLYGRQFERHRPLLAGWQRGSLNRIVGPRRERRQWLLSNPPPLRVCVTIAAWRSQAVTAIAPIAGSAADLSGCALLPQKGALFPTPRRRKRAESPRVGATRRLSVHGSHQIFQRGLRETFTSNKPDRGWSDSAQHN